MSTLAVHLNRGRTSDFVAPRTFTARGPVDVVVENHGEGARVHLHLDDDASRVARLSETNPFVDTDSTERIRLEVADVDEPVTGALTFSLGYGAETEVIELTVAPAPDADDSGDVDVDERLAKPPGRTAEEESIPTPSTSVLAIGAIGLFALLVAVAVAAVVKSTVVLFGAALVIVVVLVALGAALY